MRNMMRLAHGKIMSGRASRNLEGRVIFYADKITRSMREAMDETDRRRTLQEWIHQATGPGPTANC